VALGDGSYAHINQSLDRPAGWERIVSQSDFILGQLTPVGMVNGISVYERGYGTYPSIDGSTVAVPLAMEFARQHLDLPDGDIAPFVFFSMTHSAYEHLIQKRPNGSALLPSMNAAMDPNHPVDLILVTEPSEEELAMAAAYGLTLMMEPVCLDAFVFITHADNPVNSLTADQIRRIYSGEIVNWMDVGGADVPIAAYQREPNSGSQTAMIQMVMGDMELSGAQPNFVTSGMSDLVRRVGDYENSQSSLGYTYLYYISELYKGEPIKTIQVDGIAPVAENIRSGAYPFSTAYYGVYRKGEENGNGGKFLKWIVSPEGQSCVALAGYIPLQ
jgi:phosphate transport system substrate-binding protein